MYVFSPEKAPAMPWWGVLGGFDALWPVADVLSLLYGYQKTFEVAEEVSMKE